MNEEKCDKTDIDKQNFGLLVQKHRKRKGYSQDELAVLMGITRKSISYIECGICYPAPENIFKLATVLDISLDEYVYGFGRFDETICISEINDMLQMLNNDNRGLVINVIKTMCKTLMRKKK